MLDHCRETLGRVVALVLWEVQLQLGDLGLAASVARRCNGWRVLGCQYCRDLSHTRVLLTVFRDLLDVNIAVGSFVEDRFEPCEVGTFRSGHIAVMDQREEGKAWGKGGKTASKSRWSDLETVFAKRWGEPLRSVPEPQINFIAEVNRALRGARK